MKWKQLPPNHTFPDGSTTTQIHETINQPTYTIKYNNQQITISSNHYILCNIKNLPKKTKQQLKKHYNHNIPLEEDLHITNNNGTYQITTKTTKTEPTQINKNTIWLTAYTIHYLHKTGTPPKLITTINNKTKNTKIQNITYTGTKPCHCITTNTGHYQACNLTHHNSVTLRNIIMHALTHSDDIKLALVDLKLSEFARYKKLDPNKVVGVANSVTAAVKLLRMAREVMYKRNAQNARRNLTDYKDYKPQEPTDKISIFGREFHEDMTFDVEVGGEKKQMTAKEILEYMES